MKRVHRNLSRDEVEAMRSRLASLVPAERARIPELLKMMRLIARKSQAEYARMCGVAPRVLANIEGGTGSPTVETLEKLVRPFGYRVGIVIDSAEHLTSSESHGTPAPTRQKPIASTQPAAESALSRALRKARQRGK